MKEKIWREERAIPALCNDNDPSEEKDTVVEVLICEKCGKIKIIEY